MGVVMKKVLIIPDCHHPFADLRAYNLMLAVAEDIKPDEVVILGDFADFYGVNSHGKDPRIDILLRDEITYVNEKLDEIDSLFPDAKKVFIEGNHEWRLARYISNKAPELYGLVEAKDLFRMDDRGWTWVPYTPNQHYQVAGSKLYARHEPLAGGKHVAQNTVEKAGCSMIFGHTHRIQEAQIVTLDGGNHRGISSGWLGDKNHPAFSYVKGIAQWALGFSMVDVLDNGTFFNNLIHIIDYKCKYDGYFYEA